MRLTTVLTNAGLLVASLSWTTNALFRSDLGTEGSIIFWVANVVTRQILTFLSLLIHSGVSKRRRGGFSDLLLASGLSRLVPIPLLSLLDGRSWILVFRDRCTAARSSERLPYSAVIVDPPFWRSIAEMAPSSSRNWLVLMPLWRRWLLWASHPSLSAVLRRMGSATDCAIFPFDFFEARVL